MRSGLDAGRTVDLVSALRSPTSSAVPSLREAGVDEEDDE
jgi:hypothetical protein